LFHLSLYTPVFVVFAISYFLAALCWLRVDVSRPIVPKEKTL
jgi:hypothetical protein